MDFSLSPLGYDDGYDLSIKYPILMDYININMSHRISYNIPNVKIARYYWLKFNISNGMDTWMDKNQESTVTFPRPILGSHSLGCV